MTRRLFDAPGAPAPLGPYAQAVVSDRLVFTAGQIGVDSGGTLVPGGAVAELRQAVTNLEHVLGGAGCTLADVVKVTLYVTDLSLGAALNSAYAELLPTPHPARSTVGVAALPAGAAVEIEAVAVRPG